MSIDGAVLDEPFPATASAVPAIRHAVTEVAARFGADHDHCTRIALAVTEACANVVQHAYRNRAEPGEIRVSVDGSLRRFEVVVSDGGDGLTARPDSPGLGLGIPLMVQLADEVDFRPTGSGTGTELHLRFDL